LILYVNYFGFWNKLMRGGRIRGNKNGCTRIYIIYMNDLRRRRIHRNGNGLGIGSTNSGRTFITRNRGSNSPRDVGIIGWGWKNESVSVTHLF
jgi:hypothetical protein